MYYDFHVHSDFSSDSQAPMEAMIQEGIRLELPGICFTEHMDLDFPGEKPVFLVDLPAYKKSFSELKRKIISIRFSFSMVWNWDFSLTLQKNCHCLQHQIPLTFSLGQPILLTAWILTALNISRDALNRNPICVISRCFWKT